MSALTSLRTATLISFVAVLVSPGCGREGPIGEADCFWLSVCPNPVTPGVPLLLRGGTVGLDVGWVHRQPFPNWPGTFDIVVDWTHPTNAVEVSVVTTFRSGAVDTDRVLVSAPNGSKPKRIHISDFAGTFNPRLVIGNLGPREESVAFQIVLTPRPGLLTAP